MSPLHYLVFLFLAVLVACGEKPTVDDLPAQTATTRAHSNLSNSDPDWVYQDPVSKRKVAVVFIHGIFGDTYTTWIADNGVSFFDLLHNDPKVGSDVDIFAFGFTSKMLGEGSMSIDDAAIRLNAHLKSYDVDKYPAIVLVTHSMGGLVAMRYLQIFQDMRQKVPLIVMYSTPQTGAEVASLASHISGNPALGDMIPANDNNYLKALSNQWKEVTGEKPVIKCAYELKDTTGIRIVDWQGATYFCEGAALGISEDHIGIVKPNRPQHDSVILLINSLEDYVVGEELVGKLETPDFVSEGDSSVFVLPRVIGRYPARLVNSGRQPVTFTLGQPSDPQLNLWPPPEQTPQQLGKNTNFPLYIGLAYDPEGDIQSEYRFTLESDVSPSRTIVVKVADVAAAKAEQLKLAEDVATDLRTFIQEESARSGWSNRELDDASIPNALVNAAFESVSKVAPDLPPESRWQMTAAVLDVYNWPTLSVQALRKMEAADPSSVNSPAAQRLASRVGARTGNARVFYSVDSVAVDPETQMSARVLPLGAPEQASPYVYLADELKRTPALRAYGLSLDGDIATARGNYEVAQDRYAGAAQTQQTPSMEQRIQVVREGRSRPLTNDYVATQGTWAADAAGEAPAADAAQAGPP